MRTPEEYMGDVIGDLNSRRGHVRSMEDASGVKIVKALVPLTEMFGYIGDLRGKTQGRAVFSMAFVSDVLGNLAVAIECHREHCTTLGLTTQVANVTEHLGQRHKSLDDLDAGCILHGTHVTTTGSSGRR